MTQQTFPITGSIRAPQTRVAVLPIKVWDGDLICNNRVGTVAEIPLLTRNVNRYRTDFPSVPLITP